MPACPHMWMRGVDVWLGDMWMRGCGDMWMRGWVHVWMCGKQALVEKENVYDSHMSSPLTTCGLRKHQTMNPVCVSSAA
jgi:hypothetical protein